MPAQEIIVRGVRFRCLAPVRSWHETGLHFITRMRKETRFVVVHWTAAENRPAQVVANMRSHMNAQREPEPLSVHFVIDQLGEVYQCADADARCAHAGENGGNEFGVGIEVINRGHGTAPSRGFDRALRTETIHGRPVTYREFYPAQVASVVELCSALCTAYGLPLRVPISNGDVHPTVLPPQYLGGYRGVLGHLHLSTVGKVDPGLEVLRRVHATGLGIG